MDTHQLEFRESGMRRRLLAVAALCVAVLGAAVMPAAAAGSGRVAAARHVLLISVDGMHESDLQYFVAHHPRSALARLVASGVQFGAAKTTFPSDSFPGMIAQLTGADPGTAGVYYDDTYNRVFLPPGTHQCATATPGTEIPWTEGIDRSQNPITLDAGQNLPSPALTSLPTNTKAQTLTNAKAITAAILKMTPNPRSLLDPKLLPVNPSTCRPEYPHDYIRVNTVFNVARAAGLRTAWSDKHPAYEILNGHSGTGVQDLFTPEINSVADNAGDDWTTDNALTQEYDNFKVAAVLNEIDGMNHSGTRHVGTPAIFGMNFQTLSTAQKLPTSDGLAGGYSPSGQPRALVRRALNFVNHEIARIMARLKDDGLAGSTTIILSAKHGQSPINPRLLRRVDDGKIIDALNAAWTSKHPSTSPLVAFAVDDDGMLMWLSDRSSAALAFAKQYLHTHAAKANTIRDPAGTYSTTVRHSGLRAIYTGPAADALVGAPTGDPHAPDLIGIAQHGVVYTGGVSKIAEHGGDAAADRHVPLVVSGAGVATPGTNTKPVQTTQIAPTILKLLGLNPKALQGVRRDHTAVLPGF